VASHSWHVHVVNPLCPEASSLMSHLTLSNPSRSPSIGGALTGAAHSLGESYGGPDRYCLACRRGLNFANDETNGIAGECSDGREKLKLTTGRGGYTRSARRLRRALRKLRMLRDFAHPAIAYVGMATLFLFTACLVAYTLIQR
jgi:hypothetical protein